ncbi:MAG: ABC transporter [Flavobacterium sp. BFFFF2]|nr:MAG: ABC transporter [Flavobacterium sp. BFFFF2]
MKSLDRIPTSKIARAGQLVKTGFKVGGNYAAYYGEKVINPSLTKEKLHQENAGDIYEGLQQLKGSALKVAQMLSMDKNIMPQAYVEQFSLSQFSVPPLSGPLARKTFKNHLGIYPEQLFETFSAEAVQAASIGQVHLAEKDGKKIAVKIQYPGVADSIKSDLAMVKPFATRMFNLKGKDSEKYFIEVENKLLEETDYTLELKQSIEHTEACKKLTNIRFPEYYPEWSSPKILTMEWIDGVHLSEFCKANTNQDQANQLGQALWDFYLFQIHHLKAVHADPHPGNFLVDTAGKLVAIDFGCIKRIPDDFYIPYFELAKPEVLADVEAMMKPLIALEIVRPDDTPDEINYYRSIFQELLMLFSKPLQSETFDFSDDQFFSRMAALGERLAKDSKLRKMNGNRGSAHFLYINRTFFGLYQLLHDLKANIDTQQYLQLI